MQRRLPLLQWPGCWAGRLFYFIFFVLFIKDSYKYAPGGTISKSEPKLTRLGASLPCVKVHSSCVDADVAGVWRQLS